MAEKQSPLILPTVPVPYVIVIQGEMIGVSEAGVTEALVNGVSFTAKLGSCNRGMTIMVGKDAEKALGKGGPNGR